MFKELQDEDDDRLIDSYLVGNLSEEEMKSFEERLKSVVNEVIQSDGDIILFIDEIHRFSKAQQDSLLAAVETGTVTLIGATTENPSFEVISPLLSRSRVVVVKHLSKEDIKEVKYCRNCGKDVDSDDAFCKNCGTAVK